LIVSTFINFIFIIKLNISLKNSNLLLPAAQWTNGSWTRWNASDSQMMWVWPRPEFARKIHFVAAPPLVGSSFSNC